MFFFLYDQIFPVKQWALNKVHYHNVCNWIHLKMFKTKKNAHFMFWKGVLCFFSLLSYCNIERNLKFNFST